jgi:phage tail sheath protein FI
MPVQVSYPGVYVEEIPSGLHTIAGVATSICAFIGTAPRGPVNVPNEIFAFADYEQIFGGLTLDAAGTPGALGFAVRDFFLNGGGDAIVVRVDGSGGKAATLTLAGVLTLNAASSGTWGNTLFAQADTLNTRDASNPALFNLTVQEYVNGSTVKIERFLNLSTNPADPTYVVGSLVANSGLVTAAKPTGNFAPKQQFPPPAAPAAPAAAPAGGAAAPPPGGPAAGGAPAAAPAAGAAAAKGPDGFLAFGGGADGTPAATDVIGDPNAKTGLFALDGVDIFNILCLPAIAPVADAAALSPIASAAAAYCQSRRAFYIMDPPDSWIEAWNKGPSTAMAAIASDLSSLHNASSSYAAVYFPRLIEPNPLHKFQLETFAASGAVAGIYASTDTARGVWKAPAGLEAAFTGAPQLSNAMTNMENGKLNEIGVNCLRTFPLAGNVVWGARTLEGADILESDYKYVPVRRFTLFLEESLYRGTQWVVFEPNDEPLWSQIRLNVGAFMHDLFRQGAFQGATPQQAYFVQCDSTTTTQTDINNGIVNILVGFAPLKPAEFVVLQIQQMTGQIAT